MFWQFRTGAKTLGDSQGAMFFNQYLKPEEGKYWWQQMMATLLATVGSVC